MKKLLLFIIPLTLIVGSCKKACTGCNANQDCNNGICQCKRGYEGQACQNSMSAKLVGSFAGNTFHNGIQSIIDTFSYETDGLGYGVALTNIRYGDPAKASTVLLMQTDSTFIIEQGYSPAPQMMYYMKPCGSGSISNDGRTLSLSYYYVSPQGVIDSATLYTFAGVKL